MCEPSYFPTIPRSQYKFSMIYPVPEAGSADTLSWATSQNEGDQSIDFKEGLAGTSGLDSDAFKDCCHPMGMSTARWCTPYGGRTRPGKDNAYLYMIWNYRDCCVRGGNAQ
jgi:conjugal transfer pilus assembly protein TraU